jgi:hypothetical protein
MYVTVGIYICLLVFVLATLVEREVSDSNLLACMAWEVVCGLFVLEVVSADVFLIIELLLSTLALWCGEVACLYLAAVMYIAVVIRAGLVV